MFRLLGLLGFSVVLLARPASSQIAAKAKAQPAPDSNLSTAAARRTLEEAFDWNSCWYGYGHYCSDRVKQVEASDKALNLTLGDERRQWRFKDLPYFELRHSFRYPHWHLEPVSDAGDAGDFPYKKFAWGDADHAQQVVAALNRMIRENAGAREESSSKADLSQGEGAGAIADAEAAHRKQTPQTVAASSPALAGIWAASPLGPSEKLVKKRAKGQEAGTAEDSSGGMNFRKAAEEIKEAVAESPCAGHTVTSVQITEHKIQLTGTLRFGSGWTNHSEEGRYSISLDDIQKVGGWDFEEDCGAAKGWAATILTKSHTPSKAIFVAFGSGEASASFEEGLGWIVSHAGDFQAEEDERSAEFADAARRWQAANPKPPMPEEALRHKVIAEAAFEDKNFQKAVDEYEAALQIYPTWPVGQYLCATIEGQLGDYMDAIAHMQDYLALLPDAPNAEKAKEQIWIWQDKEK